VLKNQRCLRAGDIHVSVEILDDEGSQVVCIPRGNMNDEIVCATEEIDIHDLGFATNLLDESPNLSARMRLQAHRDQRLQRQANRCGVNVCIKTTDDPDLLESAHPTMTRRRRDSDRLGQSRIRYPGIGVELRKNPAIDSI
jgi:hypothetical protein